MLETSSPPTVNSEERGGGGERGGERGEEVFTHLGCCLDPSVLLCLVQLLHLVRARPAEFADTPLLGKRSVLSRHLRRKNEMKREMRSDW